MSIDEHLDRFQKQKQKRIAFMLYELVRRGGKADKNEFMGSIAVNYGIRRKTQEEYLEDLKYAGAIDITENNIILKWDMDKAKEWLKKQNFRIE